MKRRKFLKNAAYALGGVSLIVLAGQKTMAFDIFTKKGVGKAESFPVQKSDAEWKKELTAEEYNVLRKAGTERSGSSPLNEEKREGTFVCAACAHPVYSSKTKFESGTGWPSFYEPLNDKAVGESTDYVLLYPRTEVHCANCGGHLGHVFPDGPEPTGLRYCMNGVAMDFVPATNEQTNPAQ